MSKRIITLLVVAGAIIIGILMFSGTYNRLITAEEKVTEAWSRVETQYQRRMDLYDNVVSVIKGSAEFEQETLQSVIEARSKATSVNVDADNLSPESIQQFQQAQSQLSSAMSRLLVTVERYPELQTTQAFQDFQAQVEGTENRINKARDDYNQIVRDYNTQIKRFPTNILAGVFGFQEKGYFEADTGAEQAPNIEF